VLGTQVVDSGSQAEAPIFAECFHRVDAAETFPGAGRSSLPASCRHLQCCFTLTKEAEKILFLPVRQSLYLRLIISV
jgi:hypothetical protein